MNHNLFLKRDLLVFFAVLIFSISPGSVYACASSHTIDWTQPVLKISAFKGTSFVSNASFHSSGKIDNASVFVSSNISKFMAPQIHELNINDGDDVQIPLDISIPQNTPFGEYDGTLHIRDKNRTVPEILKIRISVKQPTATIIPPVISQPSADRVMTDAASGMEYIGGEVLIKFKDDTDDATAKSIISRYNGGFEGSITDLRVYQVIFRAAQTYEQLNAIISELNALPEVELATISPMTNVHRVPDQGNDPAWQVGKHDQWDENDPKWLNSPQEYIKLPSAWDFTTGSNSTKIAVVDTGFFSGHEDLLSNVYKTNAYNIAWTSNNTNQSQQHGTAVAGVIAAVGNNSVSITGTMWSASLILYGSLFGNISTITAIDAMNDAINNGATIINYSAGCTGQACVTTSNPIWRTFLLNNAKARNILFVFATGNSTDCHSSTCVNSLSSPSSLSGEYNNVISVTEINSPAYQTPTNTLDGFGGDVSVAAPGNLFTLGVPNVNNYYGYEDGTSFATPLVSGLAGLLYSYDNSLSASRLKELIIEGARRGGIKVPGQNFYVINAKESFCALVGNLSPHCTGTSNPPPNGPTPPVISINGANPVTIAVGNTYVDLGATITAPKTDLNLGITVVVDNATSTDGTVQIDTSKPGTHTILYTVTDPSGLTGSATRTVIVSAAQQTTAPATSTAQ